MRSDGLSTSVFPVQQMERHSLGVRISQGSSEKGCEKGESWGSPPVVSAGSHTRAAAGDWQGQKPTGPKQIFLRSRFLSEGSPQPASKGQGRDSQGRRSSTEGLRTAGVPCLPVSSLWAWLQQCLGLFLDCSSPRFPNCHLVREINSFARPHINRKASC